LAKWSIWDLAKRPKLRNVNKIEWLNKRHAWGDLRPLLFASSILDKPPLAPTLAGAAEPLAVQYPQTVHFNVIRLTTGAARLPFTT
jgi:hypothetical protein